jgi:hypothetical protein
VHRRQDRRRHDSGCFGGLGGDARGKVHGRTDEVALSLDGWSVMQTGARRWKQRLRETRFDNPAHKLQPLGWRWTDEHHRVAEHLDENVAVAK